MATPDPARIVSTPTGAITDRGGRDMDIAVLGTGTVGRTVAGKLSELGHDVVVGTRDPAATLARTEPDAMGNPAYPTWQADHPAVRLASFAEAAAAGELVVNATGGGGSLEALTQAGAANLAGKVLLDIANPLDFSRGFPPSLFVQDTDSLGEQIQRAFPEAQVVKSLNTMTAALMVDPAPRAGATTPCSSPATTRRPRRPSPSSWQELGHADVIDLGDIATARGRGDAAADLAAADGRAGHALVQLQDRPLSRPRRRRSPGGCPGHASTVAEDVVSRPHDRGVRDVYPVWRRER